MVRIRVLILLLILIGSTGVPAQAGEDLVLVGGRVMDPETGLDAVRHVVIRDGRIASITLNRPDTGTYLDVSGLVVAPGFIDLHAHGQDMISNRFQAADGVTTALDLEIGYYPIADWYRSREGKALINYGATISHVITRYAVMENMQPGQDLYSFFKSAFGSVTGREQTTDAQLSELLHRLNLGLREGGLGIGFGITYTPGATHHEIFKAFAVAADLEAPVFVHVRASSRMGNDKLAPLQEVLADSAATGAPLHIVHLNSSTDESSGMPWN
jgi:dihydroorotase-like cyclic amidohydrolase